ncbi:MAG: hypothetical protein ACREFD_03790, partial [Stellaceae bacterium]
HAEHYFRIMNAEGQGNPMAAPRPMTPADTEMNGMDADDESASPPIDEGESGVATPPPGEPETPLG